MKFGGTSVGDANSIAKVLEIVRDSRCNYTVLVVVSAMARVTDLLIEAGMRSAKGDFCAASEIFLSLKERHQSAARSLLHSALESERYERELQACLLEGEQACRETMLARELTPPVADLIASLGERLCAPLVAAVFRESQVISESIDARECIVTDARHAGANPDLDQTRIRCEARLRPMLRHGVVPVVTGFLGATVEGTLTTLGRGGSDYSASIVGAALNADEVIIWTDVDGFLTSDPRLIPEACTIPQISYRQAAALAYFGAKVLHPKTLQPVIQRGIPVWIRNTFAAHGEGTKITLEGPQKKASVKALAAMKDVSLIMVSLSGSKRVTSAMHRAFTAVSTAHADIVLTMRTKSPRKFGLVVRTLAVERALDAIRNEFAGSDNAPVELDVQNEVALITLVSQSLRDLSKITKQAFSALRETEIPIIASSNSRSGSNISLVIPSTEMQETLAVLHKDFQLHRLDSNL